MILVLKIEFVMSHFFSIIISHEKEHYNYIDPMCFYDSM